MADAEPQFVDMDEHIAFIKAQMDKHRKGSKSYLMWAAHLRQAEGMVDRQKRGVRVSLPEPG